MDCNGFVKLRDALYNMNCSNSEYGRGVLVGVVTGLMATGMGFEEAIKHASQNAPKVIAAGSVPHSWFGAFGLTDAVAQPDAKFWTRSEGRDV